MVISLATNNYPISNVGVLIIIRAPAPALNLTQGTLLSLTIAKFAATSRFLAHTGKDREGIRLLELWLVDRNIFFISDT